MIMTLTRILLGALLLVLAFAIFFIVELIKFKKQINNIPLPSEKELYAIEFKKDIEKRSKHITIIILISVFIITLASFYPFEGAFIRFNTPQASLNYSASKSLLRENTFIEADGCYFVMSKRDDNVSYYSISKYGDKVGMTNYKSETKYLGHCIIKGRLLNCVAVYDENSDTSCYFISYFLPDGDKEENIASIGDQEAECIHFFENSIAKYYLIVDGKFKEDVTVNFNGVDGKIERKIPD